MREFIANLIVICLSLGVLFHFYLIATRGAFTIYESNTLILSLEVAMFTGFVLFAILNIIKAVRDR